MSTDVEGTEESVTRERTLVETIFGRREFGVVLAVLGLSIFGVIVRADVFLTLGNIIGVARNAAVVSIIGYGMTMLMTSGEFDLSVGSVMAIAAGITAVMTVGGFPIEFTLGLVFLLAILYGMFQGLLVTKLGLPSLIVTIGTLTLLRGGHLIILGNVTQTVPSDVAPLLLRQLGGVINFPFPVLIPYTDVMLFEIPRITYQLPFVHEEVKTLNSFPLQLVWVFVLMGLFHYLLFYTRFGYRSQATGGNETAARYTGVKTDQIKIANFAIVALLAAFAGIGQLAFTGNVSPLTGDGQELIVVAAVVIGGTDLFGGEGTIVGTFLGALVFAFTQNILVLAGFGTQLFAVFTGVFIIFAVAVDAFTRKLEPGVFTEAYFEPLSELIRSPRSFFEFVDDNVQGIDRPIGFLAVTTVLWALPSLLVVLVVFLTTPNEVTNFSLYVVNDDVESFGMLPLFAGAVTAIITFLTIAFSHLFVRLLGESGINKTIQAVCYALAPMVIFFVPFLFMGLQFVYPLVAAALLLVVVPAAYLLVQGLRTLHEFETTRAAGIVAGTAILWALTLLYGFVSVA